jgi:hypothetical protein
LFIALKAKAVSTARSLKRKYIYADHKISIAYCPRVTKTRYAFFGGVRKVAAALLSRLQAGTCFASHACGARATSFAGFRCNARAMLIASATRIGSRTGASPLLDRAVVSPPLGDAAAGATPSRLLSVTGGHFRRESLGQFSQGLNAQHPGQGAFGCRTPRSDSARRASEPLLLRRPQQPCVLRLAWRPTGVPKCASPSPRLSVSRTLPRLTCSQIDLCENGGLEIPANHHGSAR